MKMIFRIFKDDVKQLFSSFFIIVMIVGISVIPALYAWLNIYSNWDPYANTGALKIAFVSDDEGYTDKNGSFENVGDSLRKELSENTSVDWSFLESSDIAVKGVEAGNYYAALIVPSDFTKRIFTFFTDDLGKPTIRFYKNQKKNPVATKISDAVKTSVQSSLNQKLTGVIIQKVFAGANDAMVDIKGDVSLASVKESVKNLNSEIKNYQSTIDSLIKGNTVLSNAAAEGKKDSYEIGRKIDDTSSNLENTNAKLNDSKATIDTFISNAAFVLDDALFRLEAISGTLKEGTLTNDLHMMNDAVKDASADAKKLSEDLDSIYSSLSGIHIPDTGEEGSEDPFNNAVSSLRSFRSTVSDIGDTLTSIGKELAMEAAEKKSAEIESNTAHEIDTMIRKLSLEKERFENEIRPSVDLCLNKLLVITGNISDLLNSLSKTLLQMGNVFDAVALSLNSANESLAKTNELLSLISERLDDAVEKLEEVENSDELVIISNTLSGDPESYSEFFSEPVKMDTEVIYPVSNYGSAVTPFYTTLSIWVGALVLAAILKTKVKSGKYPEATEVQTFFGRYISFFILAEIQTLVTVLGDLFIFKVQCPHPFLFWFVCAFTSFVFSLLIFSLVLAFSDVGKAIAVVCVVIQIAGSSGTYPIELLPAFFQKVYLFFPFPYAINAMRETIGGLYGSDIALYLLELSAFIGVALVIGLLIRRPFRKFNRFMMRRMEDTKLL